MPYTDKEDIANKYKIPTLILEITQPSAIGITAQAAIESEMQPSALKEKQFYLKLWEIWFLLKKVLVHLRVAVKVQMDPQH